MKRFVKYTFTALENDSRDKRELSVVNKFDCEIIACDVGEYQCVKEIDGHTVYQRTYKLNNNRLIRKFQILYKWFIKEPFYLRKLQAYCISCHDLNALFIGWLSTLFVFKKKKPFLVYDSHEFELGRNTSSKRNALSNYFIPRLEKFLMNRCVFSIMVNDSIADEVQRIHKLKERPLVVRSIPNFWSIDAEVCKVRRHEFCKSLNIPDDTFIVMYHGGVMAGRGIEKLLCTIRKDENIAAVILGNGEKEYIDGLKKMVMELGISERVLFHDAVSIKELWQYVGAADAGVSLAANSCLNHFYMLPNKIFENIQSLTPIIGSDFPEIRRIISGFEIGILVDPENEDEILKALQVMRDDKDKYYRFKNNLKRAKKELCWENEGKVLETAYRKILG